MLSNLLDKHAPVKTVTVTVRPNAPWFSDEIRDARRRRRRAERRMLKSGMQTDMDLYRQECELYYSLITDAKSQYLRKEIANADSKRLFNFVKRLSTPSDSSIYPEHSSDSELAHRFNAVPPFINCTEEIVTATLPGQNFGIVDIPPPYVSDNGSVTYTNGTSDLELTIGTHEVLFQATDDAGNTASCTTRVVVEDRESPNVTCPDDITQSTDPGLYSASVTWPNPNIADNSGNFTIESSHVSGSTFPPGTTSVTINAVDASQNRASCTFNITVVDTEPPVLNCSDRIVVSTLPGLNYSIVSIPSPVVTDNSLLEPVTSNDTLTAELPIGVFDVELSATDLAGNEETCFVRVEVQDRESPNITCPDDLLEVLQPNSSSVNITWSVPAVVDNSGEFTYPVSVPESGSFFGIGNTTVNVSSADPNGNVGSCLFLVTVIDSSGYVSLVFNGPGNNGGAYNIGEYNVTYTAMDGSSNTVACSFSITIIDRESPIITCPKDIRKRQRPNSAFVNVTWPNPVVVDNSGSFSPPVSVPGSGSLFGVGNTTVNVSSQDASGNVGSCQFVITVLDLDECGNASYYCHENAQCINSKGNFTCRCNAGFEDLDPSYPGRLCEDVTLPNITGCPDSQSVPTLPGLPYAIVSWIEPNASDSSGYVSLVFNGPGRNGGTYNIGEYNVMYTATDGSGNAVICSFSITIIDRESPIITCPKDIRKRQRPNSAFVNVTWPNPVVVDNSGSFSPPVSVPGSGSLFGVGNTTVNVSSQDASGNVGSCQFVITVLDLDECANASYYCHENAQCINSKGNFTCRCNDGFEDLDPSYPGRLCEDVTLPNITGCPDSQSVPTLPGLPYAIVSWIDPNASDSSGYVSLVFNGPGRNGGTYNIGEYNVTYTATDRSGNAVICSFSITII
ncbi:hyalin-like, partial [Diadema antillarum]|uniref:hyalin-like n=1 Tax=Diadema antillarum TaxID=105358 RepID=UPI003A86B3AF